MFSQSLFAQLVRMILLLALSLVAVHNSPKLLELLAQQAINSGCHQTTGDGHSHHHHH
ncbi:hypothetical protein L1D13_20295 [Vibrio tubiashii]|uniref:hypothetical protein n=1 Tax=Vibrio tubiashii TaxID=29498 RepID=UPI001EFC67FF|nr:hypothetical protein [Vibrio tubiashii]MCG9581318.1 hypothetical protein [Vibrio tubiashii]MCG9614909.1 hypothetical protein [Vibrio tubiashii]MCG9689251.1 hypothetical protein [Vibrio tubiashii]